ncbi:unnamed protein product [Medioppia subpectinata]|uniref:Thioredoxin domain-containing protein n=1 Tax=Medioppia subpectinata TaxID=1979941 RepID=A0A7R9KQE2_9ACAR|nr:unnamed protein product [Medioppia subpectinata]CAG2107899.1 unnamed protein product [Medioppia subpectinata]
MSKEFEGTNRVVFTRVNCDENPPIPKHQKPTTLSSRNQITKYPTLKVYLNGKPMKKEYRGPRTQEAIVKYIRLLLSDPVVHIDYKINTHLTDIMYNKSAVIGYYRQDGDTHPKYSIFRRVAADLRGFCEFFWVTNSPFIPEDKQELLAFKSSKSTKQSEYDLIFETYDELSTWATYQCIPIVREITFENAEEIIEEELPLAILFHLPSDEQSPQFYKEVIHKELINEISTVNFVTADADLFDHPLEHVNRTKQDLPIIAIDSFKHMYLFPNYADLNKTGVFAKFIADLHSGKLHREFHFGPEDETHTENTEGKGDGSDDSQHESDATTEGEEVEGDTLSEGLTYASDSVFKKLAPSEYRYTLLKDEL